MHINISHTLKKLMSIEGDYVTSALYLYNAALVRDAINVAVIAQEKELRCEWQECQHS
jgi:hypothetical protein